MNLVEKITRLFPNLAFVTYTLELEALLTDCDTILDLGCGIDSPLRYISSLNKKFTVGVDAYKPVIEQSRKKRIHNKYVMMNLNEIQSKFLDKSFDAVIALDVIEHFKKSEGDALRRNMERIAKKRVIISTPNGFITSETNAVSDNPFQQHFSGWVVNTFKKCGYRVIGMYGWKPLRGEGAILRFKPKIVWGMFSELTHYVFTRHHPDYAFSLLAWKDVT